MNNKKIFKRIKNVSSILFIVILIIQVFAFGYITHANDNIDSNITEITALKADLSDTFINDIVRQQQRRTLNSIRQSWIQYITINNSEILEKCDNKYVFRNKKSSINFDPKTMMKIKNVNNLYSIVDRESGNILLNDARPCWNKQTITDILNIIAYPNKTFGENSHIIVYDLFSGEILMDNASSNSLCNEVLDCSKNKNLNLYYKIPENKNPEQYKTLITKLMNRNDSQQFTKLTSLFYESSNLDFNKLDDFNVYPFGDYNREFIEKIVLPYESIGIEGLDMQLGVLITSQEKELYTIYKDNIDKYDTTLNLLNKEKEILKVIPIVSMLLSLVIIVVALFSIRLSAYYGKKS